MKGEVKKGIILVGVVLVIVIFCIVRKQMSAVEIIRTNTREPI